MKKFMRENDCDGYAQLRSCYGDVEFNHDAWGNGIIYRSDIRYRVTLCYDNAICGEVDMIAVKNGWGMLYFTKKDFDKWFIFIKKAR